MLFNQEESNGQSESRKDTDTSCLVEKLWNGKQKNPSDENPFWVFGWIISELSIAQCEVEFISSVKCEMPIQDVTEKNL